MLDTVALIGIIKEAATRLIANKEMLTDLDIAIGDGDHGINMARGSEEVLKKLEGDLAQKDAGTILKTVGMTLVSTVGGASGPLYGTALMKAAAVVADKSTLDKDDAIAMLDAAIEGVKMRGKSTVGEKTMLDALVPALEALKETPDRAATRIAVAKSAEMSKSLMSAFEAKHGRGGSIKIDDTVSAGVPNMWIGKMADGSELHLFDLLVPQVDSLLAESNRKAVLSAADEGVEYTKTIIATKGRASYLGERSLGHQDPGATSSAIILRAVLETLDR